MNIDTYYDRPYMRAAQLEGRDLTLQISGVESGTVGAQKAKKAIVYFAEAVKPLVCNVTNGNTIAAMYGAECNDWVGKRITLFPTETDFEGKMVPCIRVRTEIPNDAPSPPPVSPDAAHDYLVCIAAATDLRALHAIEGEAYDAQSTNTLTEAQMKAISKECAEKQAELLNAAT